MAGREAERVERIEWIGESRKESSGEAHLSADEVTGVVRAYDKMFFML